jgi:hypothetical protein
MVLTGAAVGNGAAAYPPTSAMKRFADSLIRQKGIKPPPGYKTSISQNPRKLALPRPPPMRSRTRCRKLSQFAGAMPLQPCEITLLTNAFLEAEIDRLSAAVSSGFARGKVRKAHTSKEAKEKKMH